MTNFSTFAEFLNLISTSVLFPQKERISLNSNAEGCFQHFCLRCKIFCWGKISFSSSSRQNNHLDNFRQVFSFLFFKSHFVALRIEFYCIPIMKLETFLINFEIFARIGAFCVLKMSKSSKMIVFQGNLVVLPFQLTFYLPLLLVKNYC